jgi:hypothetical protein
MPVDLCPPQPTSPASDRPHLPHSASDIYVLRPPYLVSRPAVFPLPTLTVAVVSAINLKVA